MEELLNLLLDAYPMAASLSFISSPGGLLKRLWTSYETQLQQRPIIVNAASSALLWSAGDLLSQRLVPGKGGAVIPPPASRGLSKAAGKAAANGSVRSNKTALTGAFGGVIFGPLGFIWYKWLDAVGRAFGPAGSLAFVAAKVFADNVVWTSAYVGLFMTYSSLVINQKGLSGTCEKLKKDFLPTMMIEMVVWAPVMALLFAHVPVAHQLLAVNAVTVGEVAFLSWMEGRDAEGEAAVAVADNNNDVSRRTLGTNH